MYDQSYIDSLPKYEINQINALKKGERLAIKHFKTNLGCRRCSCTVRTVSAATGRSECSRCLKLFKGLQLPDRKPSAYTLYLRGLTAVKFKPTTAAGVKAREGKNERYTRWAQRPGNWTGIPVVFGGMNTGGK